MDVPAILRRSRSRAPGPHMSWDVIPGLTVAYLFNLGLLIKSYETQSVQIDSS